ncbi:MAG: ribulokinase [Odoribacteraceae bacterium]|jgi:L-ribulokinase|nr:ribulokinase [Odoribacteraceae bacterium]
MKDKFVIGVDYGTDSCRAVLVNSATGEEIDSSVQFYPRWAAGEYCDPGNNQYRQHPLDYIETLEAAVKALVDKRANKANRVVGIAIDTTGSTPVLTNAEGIPLALLPEFADNPNAMFILWKDHTAVDEAAEINALAKRWGTDYTAYEGGIYSSEWVWAKVLHVLRADRAVREAAASWVEHCDWIPALITGNESPGSLKRSRCAAGHKAMWHPRWGGLPPEEFLVALDPCLAGFRERLFTDTFTSDQPAGRISLKWAYRLGLSSDVTVAVGAFDCHMGAVGAQIKPGVFVRVIGTSTCDVMVVPPSELGDRLIPGICGQVDGSVIPGMIGLEAGQSGFGDIYAWFKRVLAWPIEQLVAVSPHVSPAFRERLVEETLDRLIPTLSEAAAKIPPGENSLVATDWMNGRRTPDANQLLKGTIAGITLGSDAPRLFRALVEATAFGSRAIVERFLDNGIQINEVTGIGGIALKSPFVMQTLADVLGMPVQVYKSGQACAVGAAMFAAVAAGEYPTVEKAQKVMGQGFARVYTPDPATSDIYTNLYLKYCAIGQAVDI